MMTHVTTLPFLVALCGLFAHVAVQRNFCNSKQLSSLGVRANADRL